jgi:hypothetical protein
MPLVGLLFACAVICIAAAAGITDGVAAALVWIGIGCLIAAFVIGAACTME